MSDIAAVMLAALGLSLVCIGVIVLMVFGVMRMGGSMFLGPVTNMLNGSKEEDAEEERGLPARRTGRASSAAAIRAKAQARDFDASLQQYQQQSGIPTAPPTLGGFTSQQAPPQPPNTPTLGGLSARQAPPPPPNTPSLGNLDSDRYGLRNRTGNVDSTSGNTARNPRDAARRRAGDNEDDMLGGLLGSEEGDGLL
ncbi:MAG: hypothetical protein H7Y11_08070 [Armatimonadetes bacterium]|nr:hypothetical protein [Anaerolineae bacterium]